ncbi:YjeJ family protein [Atlantibacter hermannii]|uniref:YjeJ family protein n=1 Tax=Atlantibacter hermannii TaxID=565 RepID=UPI002FDCCC69
MISDGQIETFIHAIIFAIKNAGFENLLLTVSSMLDFIPLYDMDLLADGKMEYDSYNPPLWKLSLFRRYLLFVFKYQQDNNQDAWCGTVIKTDAQQGTEQATGASQRAIKFSRRLQKIANKPCQVFCIDITPSDHQELTKEQCLDSLHRLCISAIRRTAH